MKFRPFKEWFLFGCWNVGGGTYGLALGVQTTMPEGFEVYLYLYRWRLSFSCVFGDWEDKPRGPPRRPVERDRA